MSKFPPSMADIYGSFGKLTSARTEWTWNATYQKIFNKAKSIIKDACMQSYDKTKSLYIEMDASRVGMGAVQVAPEMKHQTKAYSDPLYFVSKSLSSTEKIQQHTKRSSRYTIWTQKVPSLLLCKGGEYNYRLQTASDNIQKRCSNTMTDCNEFYSEYTNTGSGSYTSLDPICS